MARSLTFGSVGCPEYSMISHRADTSRNSLWKALSYARILYPSYGQLIGWRLTLYVTYAERVQRTKYAQCYQLSPLKYRYITYSLEMEF